MNHAERVLTLYWRLLQGEHVHKVNFSTEFQITERSFARDIQAIRYMLAEVHSPARVCFDKMADSYYLSDTRLSYIDGMDVMVLIKLLLGTRALRKDEMTHLVHVVGSFLSAHEKKGLSSVLSDAMEQYELFCRMIDMLKERGISFSLRHCANSAAIMELPDVQMDMVRAGITLYGLWPSSEMDPSFPLHPAMSLHSHIVAIRDLPEGSAISYGGTFVTERASRVATIPVGYGDGYARSLSNRGYVLIRGRRAPILGRVCMDQFMVDVTDISEASVLDEVTLLGRNGEETITMEDLGELSGRFNYEFACCIGKRVPRSYLPDIG